ncbi:MAG TPA: UPF0182 family protein [Candidatus Dormibacteraeota bacterium]|nr:UPF0182 family protein [Candidatus Dormibacteraeota bacterium]
MSRPFRPFDPFERGGPFEGAREIRIPRPPRRFWVGAGLFALALLVFIFASPIVWFFTELQWYDALGFKDVFTTRLTLQATLFAGSFSIAFIYMAMNVLIALRVRSGPGLRAVGIRRSSVRSAIGGVALAAAALVALILSGGAGTQWMNLALFQHASPTGVADPVLGLDISFYLLTLPFLHSVANWALGLGFMSTLVIGALYAWRGDTFDLNLSPLAIAHLSSMLAIFALALAGWMWLGRYDLMYAHNSTIVWGAAYTDVNARLPLFTFQAGAGVVLAGALLGNIWLKRRWLPVAAAGVWVAMLLIGQVYPSIVQSFFVTPSAQSYELPYIEREIAGTQAAYGLSNVTVSQFTGDKPLSLHEVQNDQATVNNLRLWDFAPLKDDYEQQQTIRTYYSFNDIDIDRYNLAGKITQLEISAREFDFAKLSAAAQNWVNEHLGYTHGYGVAASPVNAVASTGLPAYVAGDLPPTGSLKVTKPAVYFGEVTTNYALAPSKTPEFDFPQGSQDQFTSYTGTHGVPMTELNKALWSLKLGDFNLLVSSQVTNQTLMLYRRNIVARAHELAPFLTFDGDPYVVVVDGRVYWILDAYTTGATYPYAQTVTFQSTSTNAVDINYVRNSVKVVIDAYEGTADFYVIDSKDPIIKAYQATFPLLFKSIDAMPAGLRAHLRVPVDLFNVQVQIYATYHINADEKGAHVFFAREDVWDVPTTPSSPGGPPAPVAPYYVLFRLPGEQNPEFLLIMPFTPHGKNNMVSWMAARSDGANYGKYVSYVLPKDKVIFGPQQVANLINEKPEISRDFTLFHQAGSQVLQGNLLVVPIGDSFLYFQPIYLRATQASSLPELKKVILADSVNVVYADNLQQAIDQLVGTTTVAPPVTTTPTTFTPAQVAQIADLVNQANTHYAAAFAALRAGDLKTFADEMAQVGAILQKLQQITGTAQPPAGATPTPSPAASPSSTP